jgi:hypothetical protein
LWSWHVSARLFAFVRCAPRSLVTAGGIQVQRIIGRMG